MLVKRTLDHHQHRHLPRRSRTRPSSANTDSPRTPDIAFYLAMGHARSAMFDVLEKSDVSVDSHLVTCTVGRKSSAARWFLPGVSDVRMVLSSLPFNSVEI